MRDERFKQWAQRPTDDCPPVDQLDAYRLKALAKDEEVAVDEHLRHCARCVNQLIDLREFAAMETAAPNPPEHLLQRVHSTTAQYLQEPERRTAEPQLLWRDRVLPWWRSLWHSPSLLGGLASITIVAAIVLFFNQETSPLIEPDLLPRGAQVDQDKLSALLGSVSPQGIAVTQLGQPKLLTIDAKTPQGVRLVEATNTAQPRFHTRKPTVDDQGTTVILIGTDGSVATTTIVRVGNADWTTATGTSHSGWLMALDQPIKAIRPASAVLDLDLILLGVVVSAEATGAFAVAVPEIPSK